MTDLVYELLSRAVKNTNITINLTTKPLETGHVDNDESESGLARTDLVQLISDLERVSATLKRISRSLAGNEYMEVLQNFDKILNSVKMIVNAV